MLRVNNCEEDIEESIKEMKGVVCLQTNLLFHLPLQASLPDELGHMAVKLQDFVPSLLVDSEVIESFPLSSPWTSHPGNVTLQVLYKVCFQTLMH